MVKLECTSVVSRVGWLVAGDSSANGLPHCGTCRPRMNQPGGHRKICPPKVQKLTLKWAIPFNPAGAQYSWEQNLEHTISLTGGNRKVAQIVPNKTRLAPPSAIHHSRLLVHASQGPDLFKNMIDRLANRAIFKSRIKVDPITMFFRDGVTNA